jgi:hypothetical protein
MGDFAVGVGSAVGVMLAILISLFMFLLERLSTDC